jgi:hypothetical protein
MPGIPNIDIDPPKYGPPNMAGELFKMISSLPDAYQQGVKEKFDRGQMARTENLQKPINLEDGKLDYSSLVQKYLQAKGTEAIPDVLPNAWKTQALQNDQPTPSPYGPSNPRITPDGQRATELGGREQPEQSVGQYSISDLATRAGGLSDPKAAAANIAKVVGVSPGERLTDEQEAKVRKMLAPYMGQGDAGDATGTTGAPPDPRRSAPPNVQPGIMGGPPTVGPSAAAQGFAPYQPGAPPQAGQPPGQPGQPGQPPVQMAQAGQAVPSGAAGMVPAAFRGHEQEYAQGLKQAAERERNQARRDAIIGVPSKPREDKAAAWDKTADEVLKAIQEDAAKSRQQQLDIGKSETEETRKAERGRSEAMITKIDSANEKATEGRQRGEMSQSLTNAPDFNAGVGAHYVDILNGIGNRLFGLPNLGTSGQFFDKLRAGSILNSIKDLGGSGAGPVRVAEMKFINTVQAGRDMNPTSIRSALATEDRLHQRAQEIFNMKEDYLKTHRELGPDFNKKVSDYANKNELFSEAELAHPELVGMPILRNEAQMRAANLPPGTPYRTGSGSDAKVKFTPGNAPTQPAALSSDRS